MTARDHYPNLAARVDVTSDRFPGFDSQLAAALDEIDRLNHWKVSACRELDRWDKVFEMLPDSFTHLGESKCSEVVRYIEHLESLPPHPAHVPWLRVGSGVMLRAEGGQWVMVLPEELK